MYLLIIFLGDSRKNCTLILGILMIANKENKTGILYNDIVDQLKGI
jgi:hypothetical protein